MILVNEKSNCCGCGMCQLICPKKAIKMEMDEYGNFYPFIDKNKCVDCGLCKTKCAFQNIKEINTLSKVYAIARNNDEEILKSASGGIFAQFAENWLDDDGIVYGAMLALENDVLEPYHSRVSSKDELLLLLGSKYVQSNLHNTFIEVKNDLNDGKKVIYSGTPCQIDSLNHYLKKDYDNLLTIDIVCHGVPSAKMFKDYISVLEKKKKVKITEFKFRDKTDGWGLDARLGIYNARLGIYNARLGIYDTLNMPSSKSSYYELFLSCETYRDSCYHCPYANGNRVSDITLGDYWGIEEEHPDFLKPYGKLDKSKGISMMIINTQKGMNEFNKIKDYFIYYESSFQKASKRNEQLRHPSQPGTNRDTVMDMYKENGFKSVDNWFEKNKRKEKYKEFVLYHIHNDIPEPLRNIAKKILRR